MYSVFVENSHLNFSEHYMNVTHFCMGSSAMSIDELFPALLECFGIILCGYVAGRTNVITSTQAKGLGNFVSKFALPALLFKNMVLLDFGDVMWSFLWSILIAKVSVFAVVCALTLVVAGADGRFGKAGLFSIFATQSNDFALGYPIVEALYKNTYPEYLQYIYLVAPVSLMILNPIGFAFCEIQKWRNSDEDQQQNKLRILGVVILQVLKNPVVFMVIIGLASHFLLDQKIPAFMREFVDSLANSFGGAALFYLGLSMVGQLGKFSRSTVVALILLITAKLLVMPLICRDMVELLDSNSSSPQNHSSLSNYAFLYGVFPTAPSVAIYASHYNMELEVITSGMVLSTFLSAPIMYVSAWLLTIPWMDPTPLVLALQNVSFNISIVSLVALVWTITVMFLSKKFKRLPHMFTMNLLLAQASPRTSTWPCLLVCVGMILWNFIVKQDNFIGQVSTFTLLYGSLYSTYVWAGLISLSLVLMKEDSEMVIPPGVFPILGWGVPALILGILLMAGENIPGTIDSAFFYGRAQVIATAVVQSCSIVLGGCSLVGLSRNTRDLNYQVLERSSASGPPDDRRPEDSPEYRTVPQSGGGEGCINGGTRIDCRTALPAPPPQVPRMSPGKSCPCCLSLPGECTAPCESPHCLLVQEEEREQQVADRQVARHALLCLLLTVSLLAGFISFGIFGLDKHLIIIPFKKRLARLWQGRVRVPEPRAALPEDIRLTCTQFIRYHKDQCAQDIVQKRRCGEKSVVGTFLGSELVEWLLRVGVARDRGEGLLYGIQLERGGVLQHVAREVGFQDDSLYYRFVEPR
ncbi:integral membrane protein GPR155 isoform X2 [Arapaima gigas]